MRYLGRIHRPGNPPEIKLFETSKAAHKWVKEMVIGGDGCGYVYRLESTTYRWVTSRTYKYKQGR